jgi:hypothetical protein
MNSTSQRPGLSRQATFPAGDFLWSKPPRPPGHPAPIPPRNEPHIFIISTTADNIPRSGHTNEHSSVSSDSNSDGGDCYADAKTKEEECIRMSMNIMNIWKVICFFDRLPCNSLTSMLLERGRRTTWKCWLHYEPETRKPLNGSSSRPRKCGWEGTSTCKKKTGWTRSPHTSQSRNQCARFSRRDRNVELHLGSGIVDALTR